jgi:hypothetical protein
MKRHLLMLASLALAATGFCKDLPRQLDKANVLPLALDDAVEFRKTKIFINEPELIKPTTDPMIAFERQRVNFGAVTQLDRQQRYGHYYTFFWRTARKADLTLRFEYRQQNLGSYVQAKEISYPGAKGSVMSQFQVIGDDYAEEGLTQSFLWN